MRSRYSAFAVGDVAYLLRTWHPSTRPAELKLDDELEWRSLSIIATSSDGPFDTTGTVEFVARYRAANGSGSQHEVSRFVRENRAWFYVGAAE
jgi:SEC-C motif-containing protein